MPGFLPNSAFFGGQQFQLPGQILGQMPQPQGADATAKIAAALLDRVQDGDVGGLRTAADFQESTKPGLAKPTAKNIGGALGNAFKTVTAPVTTAIATAANQLTGLG